MKCSICNKDASYFTKISGGAMFSIFIFSFTFTNWIFEARCKKHKDD